MNVNEAIKKLLSKNSDREVKAVFEYKGLYLLAAPHKGVNEDYSDPFFLMNKENGNIASFIPSEDFNLYENFMNNQIWESK